VRSAQEIVRSARGLVRSARGTMRSARGMVRSAQGIVRAARGIVHSAPGIVRSVQGIAKVLRTSIRAPRKRNSSLRTGDPEVASRIVSFSIGNLGVSEGCRPAGFRIVSF